MREVVAIAVSDIHLSHTPPAARAAEEDWYFAQWQYFEALSKLVHEHGCEYVLVAGDIFDRWNPPPKIINAAIHWFQGLGATCLAVPGQHDLPFHGAVRVAESAYHTLCAAKAIEDISGRTATANFDGGLLFTGFEWNRPLLEVPQGEALRIAVVHKYCWKGAYKHPQAKAADHFGEHAECLAGFDVAVFGDNHKHFIDTSGAPIIVNCGGFMRRKSDEKDNTVAATLIYSDGTVEAVPLETKQPEQWVESDLSPHIENPKVAAYVQALGEVELLGLDYTEALEQAAKAASPGAARAISEALEAVG